MKKILGILLLGILFFSLASANPVYELDTQANVTVVCLNDGYCSSASYCNINIESPSGDIILTNTNMTYTTSFHYYTLNITELGAYKITGFCEDGELNKQIDFLFARDGGTMTELITYILLLLSTIAIILFMVSKHGKTDFDSYEKSMTDDSKNKGEVMVKGIITGLFKNSFIWLYFTGWIAVLILREILYQFGGATIYGYFVLMANVYSLGLILVTIYMIGYLMTYMKNIFSILTDNSWGVGD